MNVHFFKLLQDHYFIITLYYCHVTTHYFLIITVLLLDYCKGTFHYFIIITYLLLLHYVSITTILLPDYYRITTIDCFIIPWPILWLITTWLLQLLPLLPIFITTLIPITTIITIIHLPNLEMRAGCARMSGTVLRPRVWLDMRVLCVQSNQGEAGLSCGVCRTRWWSHGACRGPGARRAWQELRGVGDRTPGACGIRSY